MSGPPQRGAAQDLSFADQQELLAFIEKRNWFEQKLDVSRGQRRIHQPFAPLSNTPVTQSSRTRLSLRPPSPCCRPEEHRWLCSRGRRHIALAASGPGAAVGMGQRTERARGRGRPL